MIGWRLFREGIPMRSLIVVIACSVIGLTACSDEGPWEGPGGTKMGISKAQVEKYAVLEKGGSNNVGAVMYSSRQAPSMKAEADTYDYVFSSSDSLCMIQMHFNSVRKTTSPLMQRLKEQYGMPVKDDKVEWGVIWSGEKYKLGNDLIEIASEFTGSEPNVSAVVSFSYSNVTDCTPK